MIRSTITILFPALMLLSVGCTKRPDVAKLAPGTTKETPKGEGTGSAKTTALKPVVVTPLAFATEFVKSLNEGKADAKDLSEAFKKVVAKPGVTDADKTAPYSDAAAKDFLDKFSKGAKFTPLEEKSTANGAMIRGGVTGGAKPESFVLIVSGDQPKVEWLQRSTVSATALPAVENVLELYPAMAFMDHLLGANDISSVMELMTQGMKTALAPSEFASDKVLGYNKGLLQLKLNQYGQNFTGYAIDKVEPAAGGAAVTYTGQLTGSNKQAFTLKMAKDEKSGAWLATELKLN